MTLGILQMVQVVVSLALVSSKTVHLAHTYILLNQINLCGLLCADVANCLLCSLPGVCIYCKTNFTLINSSCISCFIPYCQSCQTPNICNICSLPYEPSTNGSLCELCLDYNYISCSSDNNCEVCSTNFSTADGVWQYCGAENCQLCFKDTLKCSSCF